VPRVSRGQRTRRCDLTKRHHFRPTRHTIEQRNSALLGERRRGTTAAVTSAPSSPARDPSTQQRPVKRLLADAELDMLMLEEVAQGSF
jgi:hypothetical protein